METRVVVGMALVLAIIAGTVRGEDHDLVLQPAPDVTSPTPSNWKSPDIKVGADFGDASLPDIIRRGITNSVYSRFYINGVQDFTIPSGSVELRLYYRSATIGETPPALSDSTWHAIGTLPVTFVPADGPFVITKTWPTDFPSVTTKSIAWVAPNDGEYFHIGAEVAYLGSSGVADEHIDDNVAVSLYESLSGLIDIVLVHDTSGSMGYYSFDGLSYMQHAKARASTFIPAINASSRFAVVEFSSNYASGYNDVWPSPAVLQHPTISNTNNAIAAVSGLSAGGATPMGAGLQRAIDLLVGAPDDGVVRKKVILLLSDGYENFGSLRACSGADPSAPCAGESILTQLQANNIRIFSLALGTAAWTECLECLATQSSGQWYATPNPGIDMVEVYLNMQNAYTADDLYRIDRGTSGGADDSYATNFEGMDDILYFILAWNDLQANLTIQLRAPGGAWADPTAMPNATLFAGDGYAVVRVAKAQSGTWEYRIAGDNDKQYLAAVRSARVGVRLTLQALAKGVVGDAIDIRARLKRNGLPITTAKLNATVYVPDQASLDTQLRRLARDYILNNKAIPIDPGDLKQNPDIWPRAAFINKVTDGKPESLARMRPVSVALSHAGDGVYEGSLKEGAQVAGMYNVSVSYSSEGIDRTQTRPVTLSPGTIEHSRSSAEIVEVKSAEGASQWLLRVYPVDKYDNAVSDPALLKQVEVSIDGGHVDKTPEIAFDGAFQQMVIPEPNRMPRLTSASIGGKKLKIIEEGKPPQEFDPKLLLFILILIVIGLVLLVWFRRQQNPEA
jgi:Mg-chelatase subunit ChlD